MGNALNLQEINQEEALNLTKFYIQSNQNCFFFGRRGTGKTEISIQAAKECGYRVNYINLSVLERSDLLGMPSLFDKSEVVNYKSPVFLPSLSKDEKPNTVLVFDEIDKCYHDLTAPLLEVLQFRRINDRPLNVVSCILTGNLPNEETLSSQISTAVLDRGAKYILSFNLEKWLEWAKAHNVHDLILGFLSKHPDLACGEPDDVNYASPSPRGWTLASHAIIKARILKIVDIKTITQIIAGFVGHNAAALFEIWYSCFRKFDPYVVNLIEAGKMTLDFSLLEPTEKIVFVIAVCLHTKLKTLEAKTKNKFLFLENLCKFYAGYPIDPETKLMGLNNAFTFEMIAAQKWYACKPFFELFSQIVQGTTIK